jgi:hypothetical protein
MSAGGFRRALVEVLDGAQNYGSELAILVAPIEAQHATCDVLLRVVRNRFYPPLPEEGLLSNPSLEIKGAAEYLAEALPDQIAAALEPLDGVLDTARELAEYVEELLGALGETHGLGAADENAKRLAQGILRALPAGVDK